MIIVPQLSLSCPCGSAALFRRGLCRHHYWAARHSERCFDGLREHALRRDGRQCLACGEADPERIVVHHRVPDLHRLPLLVTLCRACHARVHHTHRPRYGMPEFLRSLWREQYRGLPEQLELALGAAFLISSSEGLSQVSLFEAA